MTKGASFALGLAVCAEVAAGRNHGYKSSKQHLPRIPIEGAVSADFLISEDSLPQHFDWRLVNGKSLVAADWNQHIPVYCGACWIHGTLSSLQDRIKVLRGGAYPDVMLGRQSIMNCVPDASDPAKPPPGCDGGDAWMIHKYMKENKVPDESCMPYQAKNMGCTADTVCRNCMPDDAPVKGCWAVSNFIGYGVSSYGQVKGEKDMMKEIYARGPIACSFATDDAFMMNYSLNAMQNDGVYIDRKNFTTDQIDHVMEVTGWGETPAGQKYWTVRNSWGTYWGEAGWAKIGRGENMLLGESECDWAVPTFDGLDEALLGKTLGDYVRGIGNATATQAAGFHFGEKESWASFNPQTALVLFSTFVAGSATTLVALRVSGTRELRGRPLLG